MSVIFPYPGLRPFNEAESIFFKGREEHIDKIIGQLQERHFLMITGASGDGKSSLVYAGLIPRARAGFFKAKFNNWQIIDFRPERSPLTNLANTIAKVTGTNDGQRILEELSYGFSSLVDLYKSSLLYVDYDSEKYKNSDEEQKLVLKNKASNLLIIVDQFEELFTNTENLNFGKPSLEALTLINLMIETSKISERDGLPIYIVFTMRSDYVGDCATFKGLPEQIVYSQFFVPRLKRQEIHRAILEPAKLSGNKINNRLIERLINDLSDGQDQLPILQHALNRIWRIHLEEKASEMDLIHYVKVGGMSHELLSEEEKTMFNLWLQNQPNYKKEILKNPSLSNVLSAHARELYYQTSIYFSEYLGQAIDENRCKQLIKKVFTCLTKFNDNRAVRNRASVGEIVNIIGDPSVDRKVIEGVVNLYRKPENTLLQPFITSDNESLKSEDILDITHESLIRNWHELLEWTKEENENIQVLNDFKKQWSRWIENGKSKAYLLPPGPLNYFQDWNTQFKPNAYSILKYDSRTIDPTVKLNESKAFISSTGEFLIESNSSIRSKKRFVRIVTSTVISIMLLFTIWAFSERNIALKQQEIALLKTEEANKSKEEAIKSKDLAEISKEGALKNEKLALDAKYQAEVSKRVAEQAKIEALKNLQSAKENSLLAKIETQKANVALTESEKSRKLAESAKLSAEKAEKKSSELSYISLAQNIAIKSGLRADDKELQALLAMQAYNFISENHGEIQEPILFDALRNAKKNLLKETGVAKMNTNWEQKEIKVSADGKMFISVGKDGLLYKWDIGTEKLIEKGQLKLNSPIESLALPQWPNSIITSSDDNSIVLWDISDFKSPKITVTLRNHKGLVRKILCSTKKTNYFLSAGKDSMILIHDIVNTGSITPPEKINTNFYVKDLVFDKEEKNVFVLSESGKVYCLNLLTKKIRPILSIDNKSKVTAIGLNEIDNFMYLGFNDGKIKVFELNTLIKDTAFETHVYSENKSGIEKIVFSENGKLMAASSSDKILKIFDLTKREIKPLSVNDLKSKTRALLFNEKNQLIISLADHSIYVVETSCNKIASILCQKLTRNLTLNEWKQNIGIDVPYSKTCSNVN